MSPSRSWPKRAGRGTPRMVDMRGCPENQIGRERARLGVRATCGAFVLMSVLLALALHAQIAVQLLHVGLKLRVGERIDHVPLLDDVVAVCDRAGEMIAALHQ